MHMGNSWVNQSYGGAFYLPLKFKIWFFTREEIRCHYINMIIGFSIFHLDFNSKHAITAALSFVKRWFQSMLYEIVCKILWRFCRISRLELIFKWVLFVWFLIVWRMTICAISKSQIFCRVNDQCHSTNK